jgi:hypothetical protein
MAPMFRAGAGKDQIMAYGKRTGIVGVMGVLVLGVTLMAGRAALAADGQRIRIRMGDQMVTATLNDSAATRDFIAMLPLSLHMSDWLRREKVAPLSAQLSEQSQGVPTYAAGDLGYWRPSNNFVIYYRQDGSSLPPPGIVPLGKIDSGFDVFNVPREIDVTLELVK